MTRMKKAPLILTAALLAATLGACTKKDSGIGGNGDAAHVTSRTEGSGTGGAAGVSGATSNAGDKGLSGTEYNTNNTPRTVGGEEGTKKESLGAAGGASGSTTGGPNPGGAPMQSAPATGPHTAGHTGDSTGTGPASTKPGAGK